jgi:hypothetical protein
LLVFNPYGDSEPFKWREMNRSGKIHFEKEWKGPVPSKREVYKLKYILSSILGIQGVGHIIYAVNKKDERIEPIFFQLPSDLSTAEVSSLMDKARGILNNRRAD